MINEKQDLFIRTFQTLLLAHRTQFCHFDPWKEHQQYSDLSNISSQMRRAHEASKIIPLDMDPFDAAHFLFWHHMWELDGKGDGHEMAPDHNCDETCNWFMK